MATASPTRSWGAVMGLLLLSALIHAALLHSLWRSDIAPLSPPPSVAVSWVQVLPQLAPQHSAEVQPAPAAQTEAKTGKEATSAHKATNTLSTSARQAGVDLAVAPSAGPGASQEPPLAASPDDFGGPVEQALPLASVPAELNGTLAPTTVASAESTLLPEEPSAEMSDRPSARGAGGEAEPNLEQHGQPVDTNKAKAGASAGNLAPVFSGRWRYQIFLGDHKDGPAVGWLDYVLEIDGPRYRLFTEAQATGLTALLMRGVFRQSSSGRLDADGFSPERYEERRGDRAPRGFSIDPNTKLVSFSGGQSAPLVEGLQDRLSIFTQLSWLIAQGHIEPQDLTLQIPVTGNSRIRSMTFLVAGEQMLETTDGVTVRAIALRTLTDVADDEGAIDIWIQPGGPLLPVRIRFTDPRGRVVDQFLITP